MRHLVVSAALPLLFATIAIAQTQPGGKVDPRGDLARLVQRVDALLQQVDATNENARGTAGAARSVEAQAREGGLEQAAKAIADMQQQLDQLANHLTERAAALRALRAKVAAEAPAQLVDPVGQLAVKVESVARMQSLTEAEQTLVQVEKALLDDTMRKQPGADRLLALTRYRTAEVLRHRSGVEIRVRDGDTEAEKLLRRACTKLNECVQLPDVADSGEGTSLHAAALRRIVNLEALLYDGFKRLAEAQPTARTHAQNAKKHREAAESAFERLRRLYATATLPDGVLFVDAVRADIERLKAQ